jgi:hypothetical protein
VGRVFLFVNHKINHFHVIGTFTVTTVFYWVSAFTFMLIDYSQKPAFLMKYKIQPGKNVPPDTKQVIKVS